MKIIAGAGVSLAFLDLFWWIRGIEEALKALGLG